MAPPLRALLVDNAPPSTVDTASLIESLLPLRSEAAAAAGGSRVSDVITIPDLLDAERCRALRGAVDARHERERDTVDGGADHQLNLTADELAALIGAARVAAIVTAGHELDLRRGGSGQRDLPIVEAFVRRYTPLTRPWHPFHTDRAAVTVNVALSDDGAHGGGMLLGLFNDGARAFERAEGTATVHLSRVVHGVSRMTHGVRHSLICFLGEEPAVRRELVRVTESDGSVVERWTRVIVEP